MSDLISRQAAIDIINVYAERFNGYIGTPNDSEVYAYARGLLLSIERNIGALPSTQPTLYGYNVEHLILIASVLQKENLPPERITEALTDISRVVAIVRDEFVDNLRKAVENAGFDKQTSGD